MGGIKLDPETLAVFERIAVANERLIELATEERAIDDQPGPPYCPHCAVLNPEVVTQGGARGGPLADFILVARCENCGGTLYGRPNGWDMFQSPQEAMQTTTKSEGREIDVGN